MSGLAIAYRALDPAAIIKLRDDLNATVETWRLACMDLIIEADPAHGAKREVWIIKGWNGRRYLSGYGDAIDEDHRVCPIPEGWRRNKDGKVVPRRQGAVGKAWAERFDALRAAAPRTMLGERLKLSDYYLAIGE